MLPIKKLVLQNLSVICLLILFFTFYFQQSVNAQNIVSNQGTPENTLSPSHQIKPPSAFPFAWMFLPALQHRSYPGSKIKIEKNLTSGSNYNRYLTSYYSDGLKIYALLTVPEQATPSGGFPVILFNHGYIKPQDYNTQTSYAKYVNALATQGYIIFKPDYRGNGNSQGSPARSFISPEYIIDDMNALSSIQRFKLANPNKIGIWAHSMGGNITLYDLVIAKNIKVAVIWSGLVGSYAETLNWWEKTNKNNHDQASYSNTAKIVNNIIKYIGTPESNPFIWQFIDPSADIKDITAPIQIDAGLDDHTLPVQFSRDFAARLKNAHKTVQLNLYAGEDHSISGPHFDQAMNNSIAYFNKYLK